MITASVALNLVRLTYGGEMTLEGTLSERIGKASTIVEVLPYIKKFAGQMVVIKYGGSAMVEPELRSSFASDIVLLKYVGVHPVIVHGGGKEINEWMKKLGKEPHFVEGHRVTDAESVDIVEMVLSGKINGEIVSLINQSGGKAIGLSGKDARFLDVRKLPQRGGVDHGQVGEVESCNPALIRTLCQEGYIPVISSIGADKDGRTMNINADGVASAVAIGLECEKLIFLTDVPGVMVAEKLVDFLDLEGAEKLLKGPEIYGGMKPKLEDSVKAIKRGVKHVHIINGLNAHAVLLEIFTDHGIGTMVAHKRLRG
jgi:acetylglutamate kinase